MEFPGGTFLGGGPHTGCSYQRAQMTFKFMCKRVYGRTLFYPLDDRGKSLLKIFRRTCIDGISSMGLLKSIIPIEIIYESVEWVNNE